ncbi:MAG: rod shape-determining protein MreC [Lachnospiraceae bacterium]
MKIKKQGTLPTKYWLLILAIICIVLMGLSALAKTSWKPLHVITDYTIVPMQKGINQVGMWITDVSGNFSTLQEVKSQNKKLQAKVDQLTEENNHLQKGTSELARLQELYQLDQDNADYKKVGANVIFNNGSNWFNSFTIDKGSKDGLRVEMNVMAGNGLVGIITDVGPHSATVRSIIDDASNVSGMMLSTTDTCILRGDLKLIANGKIKFEQLANNENEIKVGEQVVTSYVSPKYLQGLSIGTISEVSVDSNNLTRSGYITPYVDFKHLQEVLVITTTKADLANK